MPEAIIAIARKMRAMAICSARQITFNVLCFARAMEVEILFPLHSGIKIATYSAVPIPRETRPKKMNIGRWRNTNQWEKS
jgi:hypothetical protein